MEKLETLLPNFVVLFENGKELANVRAKAWVGHDCLSAGAF